MPKPPAQRSSSRDIDRFLEKSKNITEFVARNPRLLFAMDATASRQPTWDSASHVQQEMFRATGKVASLSVQLAYYRGFHGFFVSPWLTDSAQLSRLMGGVRCEGGHTQIARLLRHAQSEHRKQPVRAAVFVGDAVEENPDTLCDLAGQCGLLKLPLFVFQEGNERLVETTFRTMAKLSNGAYARFDSSSASALAALLGAVAKYASGGRAALENSTGDSARLLLKQLKP
ncbi:MAG: VWA domain-containing protein [Pseudomonadota bacterium]